MSVEVSRRSGFPHDDLGDLALAARISRGELEAFHLLMNRCNQMLYRVARSILKDDALAEDAAERPYVAAYRRKLNRLIEGKIDELPEAFRTVFVLRAVEEMTAEETATCLGLPPATIRTWFFRARGLLRESLSREIDLGMETVFGFAGDRCKRITDRVLQVLIHEQTTRYSAPA